MGAVLGAVPCVEKGCVHPCAVFGVACLPRCQPSCQAAWKWQVEPMINGVSHTSLTLLVECRRAVIPVATLSETTSVRTHRMLPVTNPDRTISS